MTHELPVPVDVRLMNLTTSLLVTALVLGCVIAGLWWAIRNPAFAFTQITVGGDTAHHSAASLRAGVAPRLQGNFFTMDLAAAQAAFLLRQQHINRCRPWRPMFQTLRTTRIRGTEPTPSTRWTLCLQRWRVCNT